MNEELKSMIKPGEHIYYEGKPDKKCFIFESIFNPLLPIAILWAVIDFGIIGGAMLAETPEKGFLLFIIPFMMLHLMPVWIYLGGVLFSIKRHHNTNYIVTDGAIYVSGGVLSKHFNVKPFAELSQINMHRGIFDQMFNVGDVIATTNQFNSKGTPQSITLHSISNYTEVYSIIQKLQTDIYSDIMYPNALRPDENPGYNTKYKGL